MFREAVALGQDLDRIGETAAGAVTAHVAIGYDEPSAWALQAAGLPSTRLDHAEAAQAAHRALWRRGFVTDVVGSLSGPAAYRMLVLPLHYLMTDDQAGMLRAWVEVGGHLVVTYLTGVADEHARVRTGGYPGALRDLLGLRVEEFHPPAGPVAIVPAADGDRWIPATATGDRWTETVHLSGASVLARYAGGVLDGRPAVTRHAVGDGTATYVSTRLDPESYGHLLAAVAASAGVGPEVPGVPAGIEAVRRRAGERSWLFLLNHTGDGHEVPAAGLDLLTGETATGSLHLPAGATAVIRETRAPSGAGPRHADGAAGTRDGGRREAPA